MSEHKEVHGHQLSPLDQKRIEKTSRGVFGFFVTRVRVTALVVFALVIGGFISLGNIPREADPEVKIPIAVVTTVYQGASPSDVENLITDEIEEKLEDLEDVKLVTSRSVLGLSSVTVEFDAAADLDDSIRELKDKVLEVNSLPDDALDPIVTQIRANDQPIIVFSLAGQLDELSFKQLGEELQDELESISGVSEVNLLGVRDREFRVAVDRAKIERLGLTLPAIAGAIASSNSDTPLGDVSIDNVNYNIRTISKIKQIEDLQRIAVASVDGNAVFLEDIATITDQFSDRETFSRLSLEGQPAVDTISLQILKKTGGNILNIVDAAKQRLELLQEEGVIPEGVSVEVSSDFSKFIRDDLRILGMSGVQSVILIFVIMLVALSFKEAIISLFAIPLTFMISFFILYVRGDTLNSLTLFALVLSLGLLVDTFIVILEGIFHNMRVGYSAREAALLSIAHYKIPLFSGVFTTISAFFPMLLVSGILGEYLKVMPITIGTTLLASLFVSLALVPALAAVFLKKKKITDEKQESLLEKYVTNALNKVYLKTVNVFLRVKKIKVIFLSSLIGLIIASFAMLMSGVIPVQMFPNVDVEFTYIDIEMPIGTELAITNTVVGQVENVLYQRDDLKNFVTTVGSSSGFSGSFGGSSSFNTHLASITVNFVPLDQRDQKSFDIVEEIREELKPIQQGKITIREISAGPPTGAPIEARILGDDLAELDILTAQVVAELEKTEGVIDVESDRDVSPADISFTLNQSALAELGFSPSDVAGSLRAAIFGLEATEVSLDGKDIDVIVRFSEEDVSSIEEIKNISLINRQGQSVKLSRLADFSLQPALAAIRHRDFQRTATVQANLEPGYVPTAIVPNVQQKIAGFVPEGFEVKFGGEVEDIEQSFSELWNAMIVAVLLIIFILVLQFNSFKKPLAIILALPFTLPGVVVGMMLFNLPFSFSIFIGLISLAGIVVNDAIVLLDKAQRNVTELNMPPAEAVANAGSTRLQPILLTSLTTIVGVIPLALADEFWLGLSIAIAFGLAFATALQLYLIPMFYLKLAGKQIIRMQQSK